MICIGFNCWIIAKDYWNVSQIEIYASYEQLMASVSVSGFGHVLGFSQQFRNDKEDDMQLKCTFLIARISASLFKCTRSVDVMHAAAAHRSLLFSLLP